MAVQQEEKHARKVLQHHTGNDTAATAVTRSNDLHPAKDEVFLFDLVRFFFTSIVQSFISKHTAVHWHCRRTCLLLLYKAESCCCQVSTAAKRTLTFNIRLVTWEEKQ